MAQSGPCRRAARLSMPWLLKARVELSNLFCSQAPLLAPSGTEGEAGWRTVLEEWDLGCVMEGQRGSVSRGRGGWKAWLHQVQIKIPLTTFILNSGKLVLLFSWTGSCYTHLRVSEVCGQRGNHPVQETECGEGGLGIVPGSSYRQLGLLV